MRENLRFGVVNTQEDLDKVGAFAESFDHKVDEFSPFPMITISRGSRLFAYYSVLRKPTIWPAFHTDPSICPPRDFREGFDAIRNHVLQSSLEPNAFPNGVCYMALPGHTEERYGKEQIEKMGLISNGTMLYKTYHG